MRLDSSLNIALNEQGCLRYPGPKTGYRHVLGLKEIPHLGEKASRIAVARVQKPSPVDKLVSRWWRSELHTSGIQLANMDQDRPQ